MTAKDFEIIANIIGGMTWINETGRSMIAEEFAEQLAKTNPRFKENLFLTACGVK